MRRFWIVAVLVLAAAYWAWPYVGAYQISQAAQTRDVAALLDHLDEPTLKRSLGRQIVAAYLAKSGRGDKMGAFGRGLANAVGTSVASPYLDQLLAPDVLGPLLAQGHIGTIRVGDRTVAIDRQIPSFADVFRSQIGAVLLRSYYDGLTSFRFAIPQDGGGAYGVHVRLRGLTWRLSGLDLPPDVLDRIAGDAIAAERGAAPSGG